MLSDLLMLRVACRVVEGQQGEDSSKPRILHPASSATGSVAAASSFPIWTSSTNTNAMRTLPRLHPQLANMPLPAINISSVNMATMDTTASRDGRRIAPLRVHAPPTAAVATHAADLMLGLKRLAQRENDALQEDDMDHLHHQRPHKRARGQSESTIKSDTHNMRLPSPPGVFMSSPLAKLVSAQRPTLLPSIRSPIEASKASADASDASQPRTLVSFLGKRSHDDRLSSANANVPVQATSPTSVWEDAHSDSCSSSDNGDQLSPIKSPQAPIYAHAVRPQISTLRVPTLHQWRAPTLSQGVAPRVGSSNSPPLAPARPPSSLPTLPEASLPRQAAPSDSTPMPTTRPTLVRKSSSQWRQEMPTQDRAKTRERIQRGLHNVCRGDYEAMLRIVCSMEEELLHLHTTSKDHYFLQTLALRDRIQSLRTGHAHTSPRQQSSQ